MEATSSTTVSCPSFVLSPSVNSILVQSDSRNAQAALRSFKLPSQSLWQPRPRARFSQACCSSFHPLFFHAELWRRKAPRPLPAIVCGSGSDVWRFVFRVDVHSRPGWGGCGKPHVRKWEGSLKKKKRKSPKQPFKAKSHLSSSCHVGMKKKREALLFLSGPVVSEAAATTPNADKNKTPCTAHNFIAASHNQPGSGCASLLKEEAERREK